MTKIRLFFARQRDRFCSPDRTHDRGGGVANQKISGRTHLLSTTQTTTHIPFIRLYVWPTRHSFFKSHHANRKVNLTSRTSKSGQTRPPPHFLKEEVGGGSRSEVGGVQPSQPPGKSDPELSTKLTARQIVLHADK